VVYAANSSRMQGPDMLLEAQFSKWSQQGGFKLPTSWMSDLYLDNRGC
jgi:hypothetical protein